MSLINQLLADLEKRHASGPEMKTLSPQVRALPARRPARRWPLALLLVAGIAAAAAVYLLSTADEPAYLPQPLAAVAAPDEPMLPEEEQDARAALLVPVFQLAEELSFIPEPSPREIEQPVVEAVALQTAQTIAAPVPRASPVRAAAESKPAPAPKPSPVAAPAVAKPAAALPDMEEVTIPAQTAVVPIDKQMRELTAYERAENEFRKGAARLQQGRVIDAEAHFRAALGEDLSHAPSRQALIGLLLDAGRNQDTEKVLQEALQLNPRQPRHAMLLARLELERGDAVAAVWTLEASRPYAGDSEYLAFLAAAMQRAARHEEAAQYFNAALSASPGNAIWLMGLGISLRAINDHGAAHQAFKRAADSGTLTAELQTYVESQARDLAPRQR
ncbi:MAG TPA: tetratricopeptide repeat protein [Burkholderiales bacterium]|nr:tetratricopeptide repeat protein [Burkholderiales bacterium]